MADTACPRKSTTARSVRRNARLLSRLDSAGRAVKRSADPASARSGVACGDGGPRGDHRQHELRAGQRQQSQHSADIVAESSTADENDPFAVMTMLMGELHGDAPAERVAGHGDPGDAELVEQIAQQHGEGADRVVTARFVG